MNTTSDRPVAPDPLRLTQSVSEARRLLAALDATPPPAMGPLFYQHGYGELELALRDLLDALDPEPEGRGRGAGGSPRTGQRAG